MQGKFKSHCFCDFTYCFFFCSKIAGNVSLIVNRTVEQINAAQLLNDQVNATYQQLLTQQASITNSRSQVSYFRPR